MRPRPGARAGARARDALERILFKRIFINMAHHHHHHASGGEANNSTSSSSSSSSTALARMDLRAIMRAYVRQAAADVPGYKALLLDRETVRVTSTLLGRGELADAGVVLIERVDLHGAPPGAPAPPPPPPCSAKPVEHPELRAVALLRPTRENVAALKRELRAPRFASYHLCESVISPLPLRAPMAA